MNTLRRNTSILVLIISLIISGCGPGQLFGPTLTPTPSKTPTPTITSTPTLTSTPTNTSTPTITLTPTLTPIAGGNELALYCEVSKSGGYFEYDISTNTYTQQTNSWTSERHVDLTYRLSTLGLNLDARNVLPDEIAGTGTLIHAIARDKKHILIQRYQTMQNYPMGFYLVDVATKSPKLILQFPSYVHVQEIKIQPSGNYIAMRIPEDNEQNIYLVNLQTGDIRDITSLTSSFPYSIDWTPNGLGLIYSTDEEGTWLFHIDDFSQDLLIKDGYDADWSPDGQKLVFSTKKGLEIANGSNGEVIGPVNSLNSRQVTGAAYPEWVPILSYNKIVYWNLDGWMLHDLNANEQTVLLSLKDIPIAFKVSGYSVQWSPDGHWFLGEVIHQSVLGGGLEQVYLCSIDEGKCIPLDANTPTDEDYCRRGWWIVPQDKYPSPFSETYQYTWEFEVDGNTEGWYSLNQLASLQTNNGNLVTKSTGNDPYMISPKIHADAAKVSQIEIRMKVSGGNSAEIYFITDSDWTYNEAKVSRFQITGDGQFRTYIIDMSKVRNWAGIITEIRLDPTVTKAAIEIDYVRLLP